MRLRSICPSLVLFGIAVVAACGGNPVLEPTTPDPTPIASTPETPPVAPAPTRERFTTTLAAVGLDGSAIDKSADACKDFYRFACGNWIKKTEIPADKSRWSRSFSVIDDRNELDLRGILEKAAADTAGTPVTKKIGTYWSACMDEAAVDKKGAQPIKALLGKTQTIRDPKSITALVAELHKN